MEIKSSPTQRGFGKYTFIDRYNVECSLQESSLATEGAIWLGVEDANPIILAKDARKLDIPTIADVGWVPYDIPQEVLLHTRMHLTQDQVKALLPLLQHFAETGYLPNDSREKE